MNKLWDKIRRSAGGLTIIIVAALLLQTVSTIQFVYTKKGITEEARKMAHIRLENANLLVEEGMSSIEVAVTNVNHFVTDNLSDPEIMLTITRSVMEVNPSMNECGILFVPDYYKDRGRAFHPVSYRNEDGSLVTTDFGTDGFDYYQRPWYSDVVKSGEAVWTDPYISHTDQKLICTFSEPVRDVAGNIIAVLYSDVSMDWLRQMVQEGAAAYPNAFSVVLNRLGSPIIDTREGNVPEGFYDIGPRMMSRETGDEKITYSDTTSYAFFAPIGKYGWSMAIVCPERDMFDSLYRIANMLFIFMILGLLLLGFIMYRMARGYSKLHKVEETKQRIENELSIAHGIQMGMIPKIFPPYPDRDDIEVFASLNAAKEVGGDLYDFFISDEKLWFCIGDVSGKGVPASLVMAVTRSLFRTEATHDGTPVKVMTAINSAMSEMNDSNMFVTMFIARLDLASGEMEYCNAGHNAPVVIDGSGCAMMKLHANLPIGIMPGFVYQGERMNLPPHSSIFLYTDGLTEAENPRRELFGEQKMLSVLDGESSPEALISKMQEAVQSHADGAEQSDDLTMLAIRFYGGAVERLSIRNEVKELEALPGFIESLGLDEEVAAKMNLALDEAVSNVVLYAYDSPGTGTVDISASMLKDKLVMVVSDCGKPFDPTVAKEPDINADPEDRPVGGLGIFLVRKLMDEVRYERRDGRNILTLTKKIK